MEDKLRFLNNQHILRSQYEASKYITAMTILEFSGHNGTKNQSKQIKNYTLHSNEVPAFIH